MSNVYLSIYTERDGAFRNANVTKIRLMVDGRIVAVFAGLTLEYAQEQLVAYLEQFHPDYMPILFEAPQS